MFLKLFCVVLFVGASFAAPHDDKKKCDSGLGRCVDFAECKNSTDFNDGAGQIGMRFADDDDLPECHYLGICCHLDDITDTIEVEFEVENEVIRPQKHLESGSQVAATTEKSDGNSEGRLGNENTNEDANEAGETNHESGERGKRVVEVVHVPGVAGSCNDETHACVLSNNCATDGSGVIGARYDSSGATKCEGDNFKCCEKSEILSLKKPEGCGIGNPKGFEIHVENAKDESQFGEYPWVAAILEKCSEDEDLYTYFCSGSLIHPQVVLTAAHCLNNKDLNNVKVRVGEWDTRSIEEPLKHQERDIDSVDIHPDFNEKNLRNDFALIYLQKAVVLAPHINTICLPKKSYNFDNEKCFVAGWGKDNFNSESYRANMKKVGVPVVDASKCQSQLRETELGETFRLDKTFMCAGGEEDIDACTGDGGAPLMCQIEGTENFQQAGIVAWGMKCGQVNVPGVYAKITDARKWIDEKMTSNGLGTSSYTKQ